MGRISMAHGSGGRESAELVERIFARRFGNEILDAMEDAAVIELGPARGGKIAFSTDSFVVTPLEFPGGDIGKLAVCGTANDLLAMGAEPKYLSCGFILEEGLDTELLERVAASMAETAAAAGLLIAAGDTKVIEARGKGESGLFINSSGIGFIEEGREARAAAIEDGDAVIISGTLGDHHACILSARLGAENEIKSDCAFLGDMTRALREGGIAVHAMRDATRGGLATVLNELAEASGKTVEIEERAIPVDDAVRGFSELLGLDPLYMGNEGKMVFFVAEKDAERALELIKAAENGKNAAVIGRALSSEKAAVLLKTRLGGTRVLTKLYGEGLPRIC